MNAASAWRVSLARLLCGFYADAGAEAALCISSSARGTADAFSDVDLLVLWREVPTDAARAGVVGRADGTLIRLYPRDERWRGWGDLYTLATRRNSRTRE